VEVKKQESALSAGFNIFGLFFLLASYTNIAWWSGTKLVMPSVIPMLIVAVFLVYNPTRLSRRAIGAYFFIVVAVFIFYLLTSLQLSTWKLTVLLTTANFCYSLLVALSGFIIFTSSTRQRTARTFAIFAAFLLIGGVLDKLGPLRPLSEAFRDRVYPAWLVYGNQGEGFYRDVALYGGYRPSVFASEPSLVGIWGIIAMSGWLLLYPVRILSVRSAIYVGYAAVMLYLVRSPTIAFCAPILFIARFTQGGGRQMTSAVGRVVGPMRFVIVATALVIFGRIVASLPAEGALKFIGGASFFERIVAPQMMAGQIITDHPLLGIGIGNKDDLWQLTQRLFLDSLPDAKGLLDAQDSSVSLLCNSFYLHWIDCGLIGGVVMLLCYSAFLRQLGVKDTAAVGAVVICLMFTLGGYTGAMVWSMIMILAAVRRTYEAYTIGGLVDERAVTQSAPTWRPNTRFAVARGQT